MSTTTLHGTISLRPERKNKEICGKQSEILRSILGYGFVFDQRLRQYHNSLWLRDKGSVEQAPQEVFAKSGAFDGAWAEDTGVTTLWLLSLHPMG